MEEGGCEKEAEQGYIAIARPPPHLSPPPICGAGGNICDYLQIFAFKCKYLLPAAVIGRQVRNRGGIELDMAEAGSQQEAGGRGGMCSSHSLSFSLPSSLSVSGRGGRHDTDIYISAFRPPLSPARSCPPCAVCLPSSPGWHLPACISLPGGCPSVVYIPLAC